MSMSRIVSIAAIGAICVFTTLYAQDAAINATPDKAPSDDACECGADTEIRTTFAVENGAIKTDELGNPVVVEAPAAKPSKTPVVARSAATVSLRAECTTQRQGTNRRSCNSTPVRVHTLPPGYWYDKSSQRIVKHNARGSENDANPSYHDYVRVVGNFYAPTTLKFYVHARSDGVNTTGKSDYEVIVEYHPIP